MSSISIDTKRNAIVINKSFNKAASKFGSPEYKELQEARRDNPTCKVVVVAKKAAKPEYKGLTYEYMTKFIAKHDKEDGAIMAKFLDLRGESEYAKANKLSASSYAEVREWFFQQYPEIEKFHEEREALLKDVMAKKAEKKAAKEAQKRAAKFAA
jgi:hypothetical protein